MHPASKARLVPLLMAGISLGGAILPSAVLGASDPVSVAAPVNWPASVNQFIAQVRMTVRTTDMAGYLTVVNDPKDALLLDVREDAEFKSGHVPGAVNIPRGLLEFRIWTQLGYPAQVDMGRRIFVQCQTGGRATLATKQLQDIGFTNVTAVIMNFEEWRKQGNPIL